MPPRLASHARSARSPAWGCGGCPHGPVRALTGCLAWCIPLATRALPSWIRLHQQILDLFSCSVKLEASSEHWFFYTHADRRYLERVATTSGELSGEASITAVAALGDEQRRRLFGYIRHAHRPVTREEAAANAGISRKLAAHHLDKLVSAGLLSARYQPPSGIRKVGRAPKVYELADAHITVSIPERRHEALAGILLDGVRTESAGETAQQAAVRAARERGRVLGAAERDRLRPGRLGAERALTITEVVLAEHGFEPARSGPTEMELRNCPFHPLAAQAPELVCGINHAFLSGLLDGLGADVLDAQLRPQAGHCCVRLQAAAGGGRRAPGMSAAG
jgi:predicted ArsR family transcriptional regulator